MKVIPIALLVLLGFAVFFTTFLVAPLIVLTLFYVGYSMKSSRSESKPAAAPAEPAPVQWGADPELEEDEEQAPPPLVRRARVTVESHRERDAALEAAAAAEEGEEPEIATPAAGGPSTRTSET